MTTNSELGQCPSYAIPYKIYVTLIDIPIEPTQDYNYVLNDIVLCKGRFYTFIKHSSSGDVFCYDKDGYSTYLKLSDISGSIQKKNYPEYFL